MPYSFGFSSNQPYHYTPGSLFLGVDPGNPQFEVGVQTERHAITVAGAGAGKGAGIIVPNLLRWPHNAIVIDPKGEAAELTAAARERMGQKVYVLDPFYVANVPFHYQATFNPLAGIRRDSIDGREDINVIADGLVLRSDPKSAHWDNGGLSMIAGMIAFMIDQAPAEACTLPELRTSLTLPEEKLVRMGKAMQSNQAFGGLAAAAGGKLLTTGTERGHFMSVAEQATSWLSSPAIAGLLASSTFDLADLKTKPCTVYLVLPPHLMVEHARFLRLFVRMAINVMAKGGVSRGRRCLFLLDEFYSLGRIDEISKAAGLMRGYGVSLWPILQDLGQLESLYGRDGMHTFFGNADAHVFFGNTDAPTLDYVSQRIGRIAPSEIPLPPEKSIWAALNKNEGMGQFFATEAENEMRRYRHESAGLGGARVPPEMVRAWVMKGQGDVVARSMIVFAKGSDVLNVRVWPYFWNNQPAPAAIKAENDKKPGRVMSRIAALLLSLLLLYIVWHAYNFTAPTSTLHLN